MADPVDPDYRYSVNEYPTDGTQTTFEVSFAGGYISKTYVLARYTSADGAVSYPAFTWTNDFTINISPALEDGGKVMVFRQTPADLPIVDFGDGAVINEEALDINARQAVHLAAETRDIVGSIPSLDVLQGTQTALAYALNRANHTGSQSMATVTGLTTALADKASNADVASASIADRSRANHTGTQSISTVAGLQAALDLQAGKVFDIRSYGAIAGGVVDCSAAIRAAMNAANAAGGGVVYIPVGVWRKADTTAPIHMYSNTTLKGEGPASVIFNDDRPSNPRNDMIYVDNASNVSFVDFKIIGTLRTYPTETNFCQTLTGYNVKNLVVSGVEIEAVRQMATAFEVVDTALFTNCRLVDILRDGARFTQARNVRVIGNHFQRVADDCIAVHSRDDYPGTVVPHNVVIMGNTIEASQGVKLLGVKNSVIVANTFRWCLQNPVYIWGNIPLPEGNTAIFSSLIANNVFLDTLRLFDTDFVICADFRDRSKGPLPAQPGAVAPVYPYTQLSDTDAAGGINLGGFGLKIVNNIIGWAAPRVSKFSDYGVGDLVNRDSAYGPAGIIDPPMDDASYACKGVVVLGPVRSVDISDNVFHGGSTTVNNPMVYLGASSLAGNTIVASNVKIKGNSFSDCPSNVCVSVEYLTTGGAQYVSIEDNTFDLDPFFRNSAHNPDNTWANDAAAMAISLNSLTSAGTLSRNHFKNCSRLWALGGEPLSVTEDNVAYFDWSSGAVFDGSAGNLGVRNVPFAPRVTCAIIDGVPTNATFGRIITLPAKSSAGMPTSGKYVRGHYVRNVNPTVAGTAGSQYTVTGWVRATNGSTHAPNTDWFELRNLTGT